MAKMNGKNDSELYGCVSARRTYISPALYPFYVINRKPSHTHTCQLYLHLSFTLRAWVCVCARIFEEFLSARIHCREYSLGASQMFRVIYKLFVTCLWVRARACVRSVSISNARAYCFHHHFGFELFGIVISRPFICAAMRITRT